MKALSIKQPWASLICCGLKDVENRKWALRSAPIRVLIHTGAKRDDLTEDTMPLIWMNPIENAKTMGILDNLAELPTSAVVGIATIERCVEEHDSIWAQEGPFAAYKWIMKDVKMFKEPILNVKGKLGIFDIPEITEDKLPECVDIPEIKRNGKSLEIPVASDIMEQIMNGKADTIMFNVTDDNLHLFGNEDLEPFETENATLVSGDYRMNARVVEYSIEPVCYDEDEPVEYEDPKGREYLWVRVFIRIDNPYIKK